MTCTTKKTASKKLLLTKRELSKTVTGLKRAAKHMPSLTNMAADIGVSTNTLRRYLFKDVPTKPYQKSIGKIHGWVNKHTALTALKK